jgi:putative transcriptional regulator
MIKLHPETPMLSSFVAGELPASVSVIIASHVEMCSQCQQEVERLTQQAANACFGESNVMPMAGVDSVQIDDEFGSFSLEAELNSNELSMLEAITGMAPERGTIVNTAVVEDKEIEVSGVRFTIPRALRTVEMKPFQGLGKLSRSRLSLQDGDIRTSILHIDKGGSVPTHTHKGFEITLLLQGSFEDEMGTYHAGDFIWLDSKHTHQPVTKTGCVCLTVSSNAIRFTKGVSQLLNPIGQFIY